MADDLFAQLSGLFDNSPKEKSSGFGGVPTSSSSSSIFDSGKDYSSSEGNMFEADGMIVPDIKPQKIKRGKKLVLVLDDDFSTLDLMKIYLQRDYEIVTFDNPKNAIFYLNGTVPDLIFIDCYLNVMNTKRVLDIIRTYKEFEGTPIVYLAEPSEISAMLGKLPLGIVDAIERPVKRGDLQRILDTYLTSSEETENPDENK